MNALETNNRNDDRIFTKDFFLIFGALLFSALVMYALMSTVTEYATALGSSATIAGLVSGIYIFGGLCSRIYSANALERRDWKKLAIIFLSIHFLACIFYFFANNVTLLLIVRFIHGLGFGASANAIVTIASAILPKKRFGEAFGYFMLGTTIAVGLGPYISGFFYDNWGAVGSFGLATTFSAIALVCIVILDINKYEVRHNAEVENHIENESLSLDDNVSLDEKGKIRSIIDKILEVPAIPVSLFTALTSLGYVSILSGCIKAYCREDSGQLRRQDNLLYRDNCTGNRSLFNCMDAINNNSFDLCSMCSIRFRYIEFSMYSYCHKGYNR